MYTVNPTTCDLEKLSDILIHNTFLTSLTTLFGTQYCRHMLTMFTCSAEVTFPFILWTKKNESQ